MLPLARSSAGGVRSYSRQGVQDSYGSTGSSRFEVELEDRTISNRGRAFRTSLVGTLCFVLAAIAMMSWRSGLVPPTKPATQEEDVKEQPQQANLVLGGGTSIPGEQAEPEEYLVSSYSYDLGTEKSYEHAVAQKSNGIASSAAQLSYSYELQQVVSSDVEEDGPYNLGKSAESVGFSTSKEASTYDLKDQQEEANSYDDLEKYQEETTAALSWYGVLKFCAAAVVVLFGAGACFLASFYVIERQGRGAQGLYTVFSVGLLPPCLFIGCSAIYLFVTHGILFTSGVLIFDIVMVLVSWVVYLRLKGWR